jgi:predicted Rossmann fold flavoprotein
MNFSENADRPVEPQIDSILATDWDVVIVGAGAAGLMAAASSAGRGLRTLVIEKNRKIGVKILISGGTRCNITHDCSPREIAEAFGHAERFLLSALGNLTPQMVVEIIETAGVQTKVESTGKVFPVSDRAIDVRDALWKRAVDSEAVFATQQPLIELTVNDDRFRCLTPSGPIRCRAVILTSGGRSFPGCGTTGDGYEWAKSLDHQIVPTHAALTPLVSNQAWIRELSGITIDDTIIGILDSQDKKIGQTRAATLFTHFGLSGPGPMNISRFVTKPNNGEKSKLQLDFVPGVHRNEMQETWRSYCLEHGRQNMGSLATFGIPRRLAERLMNLSGINPQLKLAEVSRQQLELLITAYKSCRMSADGTKGYEKAEVTAGGIALDEVNSKTMESKIVPGLFFAGEILDVDGPIGGYNFQAAFSTGDLAGQNVLQ